MGARAKDGEPADPVATTRCTSLLQHTETLELFNICDTQAEDGHRRAVGNLLQSLRQDAQDTPGRPASGDQAAHRRVPAPDARVGFVCATSRLFVVCGRRRADTVAKPDTSDRRFDLVEPRYD